MHQSPLCSSSSKLGLLSFSQVKLWRNFLSEPASYSGQMVEVMWSLELQRLEPMASLRIYSPSLLIKLKCGGNLAACGGGGHPLLLRRHGVDDKKEVAAAATTGSGWRQGSLLLQLGESHTVNEICRRDPWLEG